MAFLAIELHAVCTHNINNANVSPQAIEVDGSGQALTDAGLAFEALQLAPRLTVSSSTGVLLIFFVMNLYPQSMYCVKKPNGWSSCLSVQVGRRGSSFLSNM